MASSPSGKPFFQAETRIERLPINGLARSGEIAPSSSSAVSRSACILMATYRTWAASRHTISIVSMRLVRVVMTGDGRPCRASRRRQTSRVFHSVYPLPRRSGFASGAEILRARRITPIAAGAQEMISGDFA